MRTTLLIALAVAAVGAPPASAATTVVDTPGPSASYGFVALSPADSPTDSRHAGLTVTETVRVVEASDDTTAPPEKTISLTCALTSTGASAGAIVDCYLRGLESGRVYHVGDSQMPQAFDVVTGAKIDAPAEPYEACMRSRVLLRDLSSFFETPLTCRRPAL